jgi:hypothetical protein
MTIIDSRSVNIEIATLPDDRTSGLRLNYHGQSYDLIQAFASHKIELAQQRLQQLIQADSLRGSGPDRYLVVEEVDYYSLWVIDLPLNSVSHPGMFGGDIALQQASIWLFQELWLQWQDLLGDRQLQAFVENLLAVITPLQSRADLDRLLSLDPLTSEPLDNWTRVDFIAFDRQLCHLTQKKIGQQFGTKLTIDIIESMPDSLRSTLIDALEIKTK